MAPNPKRSPRRRRSGGVVAACGLVVLACGLAGCGKDEFADKTARVELSGRTTTFEVDSCGLDGRTAFVVGRSEGGSVLQAVIGVGADERTGVTRSTGLSVIDDNVELAGFGQESWERRGLSGSAPGTITSARIRGSRIQAAGTLVPVDADGKPTATSSAAGSGTRFSLDARCDAADR